MQEFLGRGLTARSFPRRVAVVLVAFVAYRSLLDSTPIHVCVVASGQCDVRLRISPFGEEALANRALQHVQAYSKRFHSYVNRSCPRPTPTHSTPDPTEDRTPGEALARQSQPATSS